MQSPFRLCGWSQKLPSQEFGLKWPQVGNDRRLLAGVTANPSVGTHLPRSRRLPQGEHLALGARLGTVIKRPQERQTSHWTLGSPCTGLLNSFTGQGLSSAHFLSPLLLFIQSRTSVHGPVQPTVRMGLPISVQSRSVLTAGGRRFAPHMSIDTVRLTRVTSQQLFALNTAQGDTVDAFADLEMTQWVKTSAAKLKDLSSIPGPTQRKERVNS